MRLVLDTGVDRMDRTGVGTRSLFGHQMRFDLREGFPAVTTKRLAWRAVVSELLWFLEGSGDERRLCEILHGTRDPDKKTIWTANAQADYWALRAKSPGDLGRVYGVQWRGWRQYRERLEIGPAHLGGTRVAADRVEIDQISELIAGIQCDPHSRRHILTAWNPAELGQMALPPCHTLSQFWVHDGRLSCQLYQRSADLPLGVPFNIASYALLTHMIAQLTGLGVGEFVYTLGDVHIYQNQLEGAQQQVQREPLPLPELSMPKFDSLDQLLATRVGDYQLVNYQHHPEISYPFAV
jgi:thymidylate synthase